MVVLALVGCAGRDPAPAATPTTPVAPSRAVPFPEDEGTRERALKDIAKRLHVALIAEAPERVLLDESALVQVLDPTGVTRIRALRVGLGPRIAQPPGAFGPLHGSRLLGACVQGSRSEPPGGPLRLAAEGWVFHRILVVAERDDERKVAAWVEGPFVYTDAGFRAIDLIRVEAPRIDHADLEFISCDVEVGTVRHNM